MPGGVKAYCPANIKERDINPVMISYVCTASLNLFVSEYGMEASWPLDPIDMILVGECEHQLHLPGGWWKISSLLCLPIPALVSVGRELGWRISVPSEGQGLANQCFSSWFFQSEAWSLLLPSWPEAEVWNKSFNKLSNCWKDVFVLN